MRPGASCRNQPVADGTGERQGGVGGVDVPDLMPAYPELDAAEAVIAEIEPLPAVSTTGR